MSAVSATGASQGIYSLINKTAVGRASPASTSGTKGAGAVQAGGGKRHGRHGGGPAGALFKQIQSAVSDALSAAQGNPSTDPNTTIENAIAKVFEDNGVTPPGQSQSAQATPPDDGHIRIPLATTGATDKTSKADGSTARSGAAGVTHASGSATGAGSAKQAFFNTLKQYGVNPQQFRQDLLAAVKDAQNGAVNTSTALKSLPTGLTVDTTA